MSYLLALKGDAPNADTLEQALLLHTGQQHNHRDHTTLGTLFSSLDIATSGVQVAQLGLDITGHNIANVNTEGFSRQRVELATRLPITKPFGQIPRGVAVQRIDRLRDTFLDDAFRETVPGLGAAEVTDRFFSQIEAIFLEPTENSFSTRLNNFFESVNDFATNPELIPSREAVISEAESLSETFLTTTERLNELRTDANNQVIAITEEINSIAGQIAQLNDRIRPLEAGSQRANDLRDDRDLLIDELSRLVEVSTAENDAGEINVVIANEQLVVGSRSFGLETVNDPSIDPDRGDLVRVQFVRNGRQLNPRTGELRAALEVRDTIIPNIDADIDTMASNLILEFNRIHSNANGLENFTSLTGGNAVDDPAVPLNAAGLGFPVTPGSFDINVHDDSTGTIAATTININAATSLNDLAADLNAVGNLTASVVNGRLQIDSAPGFSFTFANDDTDALAATGTNVLFDGFDASDIAVNGTIANNPQFLASAFDLDPAATGDNSAALALADLQNADLFNGGSADINEFFEATLTEIATDARANANQREVEQAFVDDFNSRRQEVSGVNLDEEVTNLVIFQRSFEASARVISVANSMLDTLINGTR